MFKGTHILLWMGQSVPKPAPKAVMDAIQSIEVTNDTNSNGFQLVLSLGKKANELQQLISNGFFAPNNTRVIITVLLNGIPQVLMDGFITRHELKPSNDPGQSTLVVTGLDISLAMNLEQKVKPWPAMNEVTIVNAIISPYARLGITPLVIPPYISTIHNPVKKRKTQKSTDLAYIQNIAQKCGYVFFIQPGPLPGVSIAYFGPDFRTLIPQSAISVNMDAFSNAESLTFSMDGLAKKVRLITIMDPLTGKIPIPVPLPDMSMFKPSLSLKIAPPAQTEMADNTAKLTAAEATQASLGFQTNKSSTVTGKGTLDITRYKHILRARMLVGVRGAGPLNNGLYYVNSVTHNIKKGSYQQKFSISRDGYQSTIPMVMV